MSDVAVRSTECPEIISTCAAPRANRCDSHPCPHMHIRTHAHTHTHTHTHAHNHTQKTTQTCLHLQATCKYAVNATTGQQESCPGLGSFSTDTPTKGHCSSAETFDLTQSTSLATVMCGTGALKCFNADATTGKCAAADTPCYVRDCYGDNTGFDAQVGLGGSGSRWWFCMH